MLAPPACWCCYPAGGTELSPQQHARYSRMGLKRGFPDIFVFYRGTWGIEIKRPGGRLSKTRVVKTARGSPRILDGQEDTFPALIASGGFRAIAVVTSVDQMLDVLTGWGIPLRGRVSA